MVGTTLTGYGAGATGFEVDGGVADHEIGAGLANLGAVPHCDLMIPAGMVASHFKAVDPAVFADRMAFQTEVNAASHIGFGVKMVSDRHL